MIKANKEAAKRTSIITIVTMIIFFVIVLAIVVGMNVKNTIELRGILSDSIKSQLISAASAAREIIDVDEFMAYNSHADREANAQAYDETLLALRDLAADVGAKYIYALKQVGDGYVFIFDTDPVDQTIFTSYDLSPVHYQAFAGKEGADVMNVDDEYGSFNTSAVPLLKDGKVVGIVSVDIEDEYLEKSNQASMVNAIILISTLLVTMAVMFYAIILLMKRLKKLQESMERMAHYDLITGLPNRQYLLDYLAQVTTNKARTPFALIFIDLDNFKKVNDSAGHDAGDELLRHIAKYLESVHSNSKAFRPSAGILNLAARIGGDEFIQIVADVKTEKEAEVVAQKLLDNFSSHTIDRYVEKYAVGLSIGVALFPYHSDNFHVLIKYADIAMYHAKNAGKNRFRIYNDEMKPRDDK